MHSGHAPGCVALAPAGVQRPARHCSIKVVAAELRVPVRRQHLEDALQQQGAVKSAPCRWERECAVRPTDPTAALPSDGCMTLCPSTWRTEHCREQDLHGAPGRLCSTSANLEALEDADV